jgi:hypothetical protein
MPTSARTPIDPQELVERAAWRAGVIGAVNVASMILAARLIVLISVLGGIVLTWTALADPNGYRLGALAIYSLCVVGSSVWLAGR